MPTALETGPERFHPRVETNLPVEVLLHGKSFLTEARDLSMAGVYLVGYLAQPGEQIELALPLPGDREILCSAEVKRRGPDGVAVEFDQLDWEDLFALARYLHPRLP